MQLKEDSIIIPLFTSLICSSKTTRKAETSGRKIRYPLLPTLYTQIGPKIKTFSPDIQKFFLIEHATVPKFEYSNTNY